MELSIEELETYKSILHKKKLRRSSSKFEGACLKLHIADIIAETFDAVIKVCSSDEEGTKYTLLISNDIDV